MILSLPECCDPVEIYKRKRLWDKFNGTQSNALPSSGFERQLVGMTNCNCRGMIKGEWLLKPETMEGRKEEKEEEESLVSSFYRQCIRNNEPNFLSFLTIRTWRRTRKFVSFFYLIINSTWNRRNFFLSRRTIASTNYAPLEFSHF